MANDQDALPKDVHDRIFREKILTDSRYTSVTPQERPKLIILGGQPGAGKGTLVKDAIVESEKNVAVVDPDELRDRHLLVRQFRREDPYEWSGRTHADAGAWADELRLASMTEKKNLIYDTTLSSGDWTLTVIDQAKARGYDVEIRVAAAHELASCDAIGEGRVIAGSTIRSCSHLGWWGRPTVAVGASTGGTAVLRPSRRSALLKTSYSQRTSRSANCPSPTTFFRKEGNQ